MSSLPNSTLAALRTIHEREMRFSCNVSRSTSPGKNEFNQPLPASWAAHPSNPVKCLFNPQPRSNTGERQTPQVSYNIGEYQVEVPVSIDVLATDRIDLILDQLGANVAPDVIRYEIKEILTHPTHKLLKVQAIR